MLFMIILTAFILIIAPTLIEKNNEEYMTYMKDEMGYEEDINTLLNDEEFAYSYKF